MPRLRVVENRLFTTIAGRTCRVEFKDDLPAATWITLAASVSGTGSVVPDPDPCVANLPKRFYRAVEMQVWAGVVPPRFEFRSQMRICASPSEPVEAAQILTARASAALP